MKFTFSIIAIIVGVALWKLIDFQQFRVEKPALAVVYFITFVFSIYVIVQNVKKTKG